MLKGVDRYRLPFHVPECQESRSKALTSFGYSNGTFRTHWFCALGGQLCEGFEDCTEVLGTLC